MQARDVFALEGLAELGAHKGIDTRPILLRVLTDLYVHRLSHTPAEERHYTELALRLLEAVDVATRVAVARRFARYLSPPLRVLQRLARDLPEIANELCWHPLLQSPASAPAPQAERIPMRMAEIEVANREERPAGDAHAVNRATAGTLNELFFTADAQERRVMLLNLDVVAPVAADSVRVVRDPAVAQRLEAAALAGKPDDFALELARALHIPREQARLMVRDALGESIVLAAKVIGMPRESLCRVLMFLNSAIGHSVDRVHALAALFDELPEPAAASMLAVWQALAQQERPSAKYRPLLWDDQTGRRARPSTVTHRTPSAARPDQRRTASSERKISRE
jgi:hypothetical protein